MIVGRGLLVPGCLPPSDPWCLPPHRAAQIELLNLLVGISEENNLGQGVAVKIKFNIVASLYDYNPNLAAFMKVAPCSEYRTASIS